MDMLGLWDRITLKETKSHRKSLPKRGMFWRAGKGGREVWEKYFWKLFSRDRGRRFVEKS